MSLKFGVEFVPYYGIDRMVGLAKLAERLRFREIWVCDHYHNWYVHSVLPILATRTKTVRLGPGVTNPYLVHPAVTAAAVATLNEFSGGRAMLGISAGDPFFLSTVGVNQEDPVTAVGEAVRIMRELLRGKRVDFRGKRFNCSGAKLRFPPSTKIPIYIGGRKRRMLELAGSLADGALINASHPDDIRECLKYISSGGKSRRDLDAVAYMGVSVDRDEERARRAVRGVAAFVAASAPRQSLERQGVSEGDVERIRGFLRAGDLSRAREAVTDRIIDGFSVAGTPDVLERRLEELRKIGIKSIVIGSPIGPKPEESLKLISKVI
ncbi:MAG: 5,10-methylenetetrahydromethanopterin reductase [Candidatus Hadarchaeales archaeon]